MNGALPDAVFLHIEIKELARAIRHVAVKIHHGGADARDKTAISVNANSHVAVLECGQLQLTVANIREMLFLGKGNPESVRKIRSLV